MPLNLDLFPPVASRRELVFDTLPPDERSALESRGYTVILLRTLPRSDGPEEDQWLARLLQGVTDGTVTLSKEREAALTLQLRARKLLSDKTPPLQPAPEQKPDVESDPLNLLDWAESRHVFRGATTMEEPEKVAEFMRSVAEHQPAEPEQKKRRKR